MKKAAAGLFAVLATAALAGTASAQVCAGFPSSDRGFYFGGRADFPEDQDSFGVEANYNAAGPIGVYGGLNVITIDEVEDSDTNEFFAGVAFETPALGMMIGPRVSACPVIEGRVRSFEDFGDLVQVPIGLGLGADLGIPVGPSVSGYVQPQVVFSRFNPEDDDIDTETETDFGIKAGANIGFSLLTIGGEVRHVFQEDADPLFAIRVGIRL
ncbi:outer membrane beta-barrel protein [Longimicrobium terrae]|uniref:Outer membrane protein beta-barrel domain-containing protein n=1 Tax=Longimicrobium terrae TaxID=1639882 RepID=A0A841GXY9_9BACT|nr:outer membrane beta-barrel protein [Longimicrobium terrae]MBB4636217.1 hypothetical protein [Longimicrobium terrae]MBB6070612.1 hypothetical protein [Longimicrobium terrae]NNC29597.1 outer membrane beta-barrel protein [Longimicrobium terrae]